MPRLILPFKTAGVANIADQVERLGYRSRERAAGGSDRAANLLDHREPTDSFDFVLRDCQVRSSSTLKLDLCRGAAEPLMLVT
jgi:hypothetical protein